MKNAVLALVALAAAPASALGQHVKDFCDVEGARANRLRGYGIVTGLNGTGDSPEGESARHLRNMLQGLCAPEVVAERLNSRNAALVLVTAELAAFQKKGTRLDVSVSAVGDCRSLHGGELQLTDLRGPMGRRDPAVYALASGRLIVQGDPKRGNPTAAVAPGGAIVEKELEHRFVTEIAVRVGEVDVRRKAFRLVLKRPDLATACQIAHQINAQIGGRIAAAPDGGSIVVRVPTVEEYTSMAGEAPAADYEEEPARWLDAILSRPVNVIAAEPPLVVIDDAAKTISWIGDVRLRDGSVLLAVGKGRPGVFRAREGERLSDFIEKVTPAVSEQQMVDVIKSLNHAGLIRGEVRSQ